MQRFLVLLVLSWFMNYFIFEPVYLALHLLVGEPTLSVAWQLMFFVEHLKHINEKGYGTQGQKFS